MKSVSVVSGGEPSRTVLTVIVALDGTPAAEVALPVAAAEARAHGATLVLVRIVPQPFSPMTRPQHGPTPPVDGLDDGMLEETRQEARNYLEEAGRRLAADLKAEVVCESGDPFTGILAEVRRHPAPMLVMTSHATAARPLGPHSELARRLLTEGLSPTLLVPPA